MQALSRRRVAHYAAEKIIAGTIAPQVLARQLAAYLIERKQTKQADLLIQDIQSVLARRFNTTVATVHSVFPLTETVRQAVKQFVQHHTQSEKVILEEQQDPRLIGGLTITTTDHFFDGSVRTQLQQLTTAKDKE